MTRVSVIRFFLALRLQPDYALAVIVVVLASGIWTVALDPRELDSGLGMLLFAQMFLASTGFSGRACRGHFDPVLAGRGIRTSTAVSHWGASILPGLAAWLLLVVVALTLGSPAAQSALVGRRAAAWLIVSALAWSGGFLLPRGAAAVVWSAALVFFLLQRPEWLTSVVMESGPRTPILWEAAALVVCPFLLIGHRPLGSVLSPPIAVIVAGTAMLAVCWFARRLDVYLLDQS
jgi:hypothetical protein